MTAADSTSKGRLTGDELDQRRLGPSIIKERAVDGLEASRMAADAHPDVMLLDVAMPRMGGVDALSTMPHESTRVILLTAAIEPAESSA
jgi:CheY-like chemotaxis protein